MILVIRLAEIKLLNVQILSTELQNRISIR